MEVHEWGSALLDGVGPDFTSVADGEPYDGITFDVTLNGRPMKLHFKLMRIEELEIDPDVAENTVDKFMELQNLGMMG